MFAFPVKSKFPLELISPEAVTFPNIFVSPFILINSGGFSTEILASLNSNLFDAKNISPEPDILWPTALL